MTLDGWHWLLLLLTCHLLPAAEQNEEEEVCYEIHWRVNPLLLPPEKVYFPSYSSLWNERLKEVEHKRLADRTRNSLPIAFP